MITGKELVEKMYSDNYSEYEDIRLYSTGDDELDELLERAFCEGYEYAQREFGNKENKAANKKFIAEQFGSNPNSGESNLQAGRRTLRNLTVKRTDIGGFVAGSGSERGIDGIINGEVSRSKGSRIANLSPERRKQYLEKHNLKYDLNTNSYIRQQTPKQNNPSPTTTQLSIPNKPKLNETKKMNPNSKRINSVNFGDGKVGQFVKNNKVGLGIGAAAIGTGAYLLHRHNKKKKEEEEKKKNSK